MFNKKREEKKNNVFREYCTGCGLCHSESNIQLEKNEKGFLSPVLEEGDSGFCERVCPSSGVASNYMSPNIWGKYEDVYEGWSTDDNIRNKASSGGIITSLCCSLLEEKEVDAIIQVKASEDIPFETSTVISETVEDVINCTGSRYSISSPLFDLLPKLDDNKRYALVAKPCDIAAIKMYIKHYPEVCVPILYYLSFFCAGIPSNDAQHKLMYSLKCESVNDCKNIQYRGNGWPGSARIEMKDGTIKEMSYEESWGKILGRDVNKMCRFCLDGIGEFADVSCGDLWYLDDYNQPVFSESKGRNVIFARNEAGTKLIDMATQNGFVYVKTISVDSLKNIQKYQFERRAFMKSMIRGLKICKKAYPDYNKKTLNNFASFESKINGLKRTKGIIKRVIKGRI